MKNGLRPATTQKRNDAKARLLKGSRGLSGSIGLDSLLLLEKQIRKTIFVKNLKMSSIF